MNILSIVRISLAGLPWVLLAAGTCTAQTLSADEILKRVDENIGSETKVSVARMIVQERRESRTIELQSSIRGMKQSFTEFLAPARDRGTKMLKLSDQLWTYTPSTDRIILIAGHMLRQSVMGSDLSYEDLMEDPELHNLYDPTIAGEEVVAGRACWILNLTSKGGDIAYQSRKVWVDRERFSILREDRFAKSGKLLKTTEVKETRRIGKKWVATDVVFRDVLKAGNGTQFQIESIQFDVEIPPQTFSKAALKK
jgi:outer membrane lipoprotein-sorting protein